MKHTYTKLVSQCALLGAVVMAMASCSNLPKIAAEGELHHVVAYIEELGSSTTQSFSVDEQGGYMDITARISENPKEQHAFVVKVEPELLEQYNKENNTSFEMLPAENYDLEWLASDGTVKATGKSVTVNLKQGEYGSTVRLHVKKMSTTVASEEGETEQMLPTYKNYVIPVALASAPSDANLSIQSKAYKGLFFLNRKFSAKALHLNGRQGIEMIYLKDVEEPIEEEINFTEWTYQVFVKFDYIGPENIGWAWFSPRSGHAPWGYHCLYGPSGFTFFDPSGGKRSFNQSDFKDFAFEPNKWYNLAMTCKNKGTEQVEVKFYVDAKLAMAYTFPGQTLPRPRAFIGNSAFRGFIRDYRFWQRALTGGEIRETMWAVNPNAEGLLIYMPFNGNFNNEVPGKENTWLFRSQGNHDFNTTFTLPE